MAEFTLISWLIGLFIAAVVFSKLSDILIEAFNGSSKKSEPGKSDRDKLIKAGIDPDEYTSQLDEGESDDEESPHKAKYSSSGSETVTESGEEETPEESDAVDEDEKSEDTDD